MPPPSPTQRIFMPAAHSAAKRSHSNAQRRAQPEHRRLAYGDGARLQSAFETGNHRGNPRTLEAV